MALEERTCFTMRLTVGAAMVMVCKSSSTPCALMNALQSWNRLARIAGVIIDQNSFERIWAAPQSCEGGCQPRQLGEKMHVRAALAYQKVSACCRCVSKTTARCVHAYAVSCSSMLRAATSRNAAPLRWCPARNITSSCDWQVWVCVCVGGGGDLRVLVLVCVGGQTANLTSTFSSCSSMQDSHLKTQPLPPLFPSCTRRHRW